MYWMCSRRNVSVLVLTVSLINSCESSCSTSVAVEGRRSSVTCQFLDDITWTRADIEVLRYDLDEPFIIAVVVVSCYWPVDAQSPLCSTNPGYEIDASNLFETATIVIPKTSNTHAGVYKCQDSLHDQEESSNCSLFVKGNRNSCTAGIATEGDTSFIVCHFNSDLRHTKDSFVIKRFMQDGVTNTVFACNWARHGHFMCTHGPDYLRTSDITRTVVISIRNTGPQHAGQYQCITVPQHEGVTVDSCQLDVTTTTTTTLSNMQLQASNFQLALPNTASNSGCLKTPMLFSIFIPLITCVDKYYSSER